MRKAGNLPPSCAVVTKSGNLNFLGPSGPVQACNGTALPYIKRTKVKFLGREGKFLPEHATKAYGVMEV